MSGIAFVSARTHTLPLPYAPNKNDFIIRFPFNQTKQATISNNKHQQAPSNLTKEVIISITNTNKHHRLDPLKTHLRTVTSPWTDSQHGRPPRALNFIFISPSLSLSFFFYPFIVPSLPSSPRYYLSLSVLCPESPAEGAPGKSERGTLYPGRADGVQGQWTRVPSDSLVIVLSLRVCYVSFLLFSFFLSLFYFILFYYYHYFIFYFFFCSFVSFVEFVWFFVGFLSGFFLFFFFNLFFFSFFFIISLLHSLSLLPPSRSPLLL